MRREPLITTASVTAVVAAVVGLLVAFGVDLSGDQQTAILGVVGVVAPLIVGFVGRRSVTPNVKGTETPDDYDGFEA